MKIEDVVKNEKVFLTLSEMLNNYEKSPKDKFLFSGVKEKSFGLVFGPSKSGKTIFCENLAMKLAIGASEFFGNELPGVAQKVLFVGLEEFWKSRAERNAKQFSALSDAEKELVQQNYLFQSLDFPRHIVNDETWDMLENLIQESEAETVIIDSITRLNHGRIEESKTAEEILSRLREICYRNGVTLICIHHTPKMNGKPLTMDSIKGSAVFAQEADFAIGVNRAPNGQRYLKNVFFRYAADDFDTVKSMSIDDSTWMQYNSEVDESSILHSDGRENKDVKDFIVNYFNSHPEITQKTGDVVNYFTENLDLKERQIKTHLSDLVNQGLISRPDRGVYTSIQKIGGENA